MNDNKTQPLGGLLSETLNLIRAVGTPAFGLAEKQYMDFQHGFTADDPGHLLACIHSELKNINERILDMTWLNEHLRILNDFGRTCSETLDEKVLMEEAYNLVSQVMPTDAFFIALYDKENQKIQIPFMMDDGEFILGTEIPFDDNSFTAKVITSKETIHGKTAKELDEFNYIIGTGEGNTCIFVPLLIDDQVKGVISAQSNHEFAYRREHEDLLKIIGNQVISSIVTARLYSENYELSQTDEMTSLGNYRAFHSDLEKMMTSSNAPVALLMIDSDGLKGVNDHFGHQAGDLYLKRLANGMKRLSSANRKAYRYAGDEFMFIIRDALHVDLESIFLELKSFLNNNPLNFQGSTVKVSISGGGAFYPEKADSAEALKKCADLALYEAKRNGKNQFILYS
ncbi:diguanylate cyclase [Peribacillus sp. SCS-37]|uniref:sensor domain-containing diguanylate cyclase n=1 Tax=Paraperibacillus esterisolvens TaxID=3115296 RepID=UPI0039069CF6